MAVVLIALVAYAISQSVKTDTPKTKTSSSGTDNSSGATGQSTSTPPTTNQTSLITDAEMQTLVDDFERVTRILSGLRCKVLTQVNELSAADLQRFRMMYVMKFQEEPIIRLQSLWIDGCLTTDPDGELIQKLTVIA